MPSRDQKYQVITDQSGYFFPTRDEAVMFAAEYAKKINDREDHESTRITIWSMRSKSRVLTVCYHRAKSGEFMGEPWSVEPQTPVHKHDRYGRELPGDIYGQP
jgi:hypothetical protein